MKKIEQLLKYLESGKILKLQQGGTPRQRELAALAEKEEMAIAARSQAAKLIDPLQRSQMMLQANSIIEGVLMDLEMLNPQAIQTSLYMPQTKIGLDTSNLKFNAQTNKVEGNIITTEQEVNPQEFFLQAIPTDTAPTQVKQEKASLSAKAAAGIGMASELAAKAFNIADEATMGDKNFSASSQAIDTAVHGASSALMKSGNPWAIAAGAALEGLNFATKAGGKNVPGYDVNITNSGYGTIGHQESEAGRIWDNWNGNTARKLKKRNEQARMALAAADISEDQAFEQEARSNSVTNVLQLNQIALAGGIDTSLLGN